MSVSKPVQSGNKLTPSIYDIVRDTLKAGGYDGLFNSDGECACETADLFPCDMPAGDCRAGYKRPCPSNCGEHYWHIVERKEEKCESAS